MDFFDSSSSSSKKKSRKAWSKSKSPEGSKSSSSHKHTLKSHYRFEPKSPDYPPPKSHYRFEPKSPDYSPPKPKTSDSTTPKSKTPDSTTPKSKTPDNTPPKVKAPDNIPSKSSSSAPQHYGDVKLKMPTLLSDKINYDAAIAKKMDKIYQSYNKLEPFTSSFYLSNLFYLYLFKKYKMECHMPNKNEKEKLHFFLDISNHSKEDWFDDFVGFQIDAIKLTAKYVSECITSGIKILIIPLTIQMSEGAHANLLIYRANTGVMEHFEPHGHEFGGRGSAYINKTLNGYLEQFVKLINKDIKANNKTLNEDEEKLPKITLIKAHDTCPEIRGVQALEERSVIPKNALIEPEGYCEAWSMFFTELCLKNPEMSSREIYTAIMDKTQLYDNKNNYLRNIIRGYTAFINNKIAKHFSRVFDEPITSAKIHNINTGRAKAEGDIFFDKLLEIMEVEAGRHFYAQTQKHPDVKVRYKEFTQGIRTETSSSSLKGEDRLSPKRKATKATAKASANATAKASANAVTRKASPEIDTVKLMSNKQMLSKIMKEHRIEMALLAQQDKEEKAAAKILAKEEKETEKQRLKDEKLLAKSEKVNTKTVAKSKKAATMLEDLES
jgi:hypothetical protein